MATEDKTRELLETRGRSARIVCSFISSVLSLLLIFSVLHKEKLKLKACSDTTFLLCPTQKFFHPNQCFQKIENVRPKLLENGLTIVKNGTLEFYGTLGNDRCADLLRMIRPRMMIMKLLKGLVLFTLSIFVATRKTVPLDKHHPVVYIAPTVLGSVAILLLLLKFRIRTTKA